MGGLAVILLLLIIFLGIEGAREAIGGFFNFVLWGVILILVLCLLGKICGSIKGGKEQTQKRIAEIDKKAEEEAKRMEWKQSYKSMWKFWLKTILIVTALVVLLAIVCMRIIK